MVAVMALSVAVSMGLINRRVKEQIRADAAEQLNTAESVLKVTQQHRDDELLLRYRNVVNEPRVKAWATSEIFSSGRVQSGLEQNTLLNFLQYLVQEGLCDSVMLTPAAGKPLIVARDSQFDKAGFEMSCSNSIEKAFQNQSAVGTIRNGDSLFDIVTIPILVGDTNSVLGTFTFGVENTLPQEFFKLTQSELALFSGGQVVDSTFRNFSLTKPLPEQFTQMIGSPNNNEREIVLNGDRFLCHAGWLNDQLGYLVLFSDEKPLHVLQSTQQMILLIGFAAVIFGAIVIWFLINKATRPLRELRDSAEAVGRGDFSRRVAVRSKDECGELAVVFNRMTENLQQSRAQLEKTVETLKTTQEQLIQSEKLSAVGEFVAGVAHELNNPLTAVMGFSELLKNTGADEKNRRYLDMIFKSAQRCQKIVQSLLSFARRHKPERKPVVIKNLVESVLEIVAYPLRTSNVELATHFDSALPVVMADEHQLQQVLLNIINNARQAIESQPPSSGGQIKIITQISGQNARITIRDNGPGISEENLRKIFDPFFTTKEVGKGTGLGLSLCYGIIREHGGSIVPSNAPGGGAQFTIELPAMQIPADNAEKPIVKTNGNAREGVGKKVLVIDDEEILLEMLREELACAGYTVDVAADGTTALKQIEQNHYDALLCDWKMPGLNGRGFYDELREKNSGLCQRVIFVTGDVVNEQMRHFLEQEKRPYLAKPFSFDEVRQAVKSVALPA